MRPFSIAFDYKSLFNQISMAIQDPIILLNHEGQVLYTNNAFKNLYGWTLNELQDMEYLPFISYKQSTLTDSLSKALHHEEALENVETTHITKDGRSIQLSITYTPVRYSEGQPLGLLAAMRDITGQKAIHNFIERAAEPVFIHDHGVIVYMNQACAELLKAKQPNALLGAHIFDFIHEDFVELMQERTKSCYVGEEVDAVDIKIVVKNEVLWITISPTPVLFRGQHCTQVSLRDVTAQYDRQHKLEEWAFQDALTGLPNRRYFIQVSERKLSDSEDDNTSKKRTKHRFAMMSLDCDKFKQINDTLGHDVGDQVLKRIGHVIEHNIRETDVASRIGGDEFLVIFEVEKDEQEIHWIVDHLLEELNQEWEFNTTPIHIGVSYGLVFHTTGETLQELMNRADRTLYKSKHERLIQRLPNGQHLEKGLAFLKPYGKYTSG